jgi:hypothetical protein
LEQLKTSYIPILRYCIILFPDVNGHIYVYLSVSNQVNWQYRREALNGRLFFSMMRMGCTSFTKEEEVFFMKKMGILLLAAALAAFSAGAMPAEAAKTFLSIATGGVAGVYYPLGGGLAQVLNNHVPDVEVTAESGNASAANINLIAAGEVTMALVQNDVAFRAVKGEKPFKAPVTNLRMIASLYPEHVQCIPHSSGVGIRIGFFISGPKSGQYRHDRAAFLNYC